MQKNDHIDSGTSLSTEKIIDIIRTVRNELIKDLLKEDRFEEYFNKQFNKPLSKVKKEFIKRELKELLIHPIDLVHYSKMINLIKETNSAALSEQNYTLFYDELDVIFRKYTF
jgi:Rps23 Pro-64 3,4-dihydroxylase Tpa1-like proline 4-hydroxylase